MRLIIIILVVFLAVGCKAFNMPDNLHNPLSVEAEDAEE